jgi:hypothetical protein
MLMASKVGDLAYRMRGEFLELCDCYSVCPCWVGRSPDDDRCTGAFAWSIAEGEIDGIDVAGTRVVSVSFHSGHRDTGGQEVFLFVDEGVSDEQYEALVAAFTGQAGGPLGELRTLMGVLRGTERAAIDLSSTGRYATLTVDHRISGDAQMLVGADGEITELSHGRLSVVLGPTAEVGISSAFRVDIAFQSPGALGPPGFGIDVRGRAAMRGPFRYQHKRTRR